MWLHVGLLLNDSIVVTELGSKYMLPTEIGTLITNLSSIKYTTDPFIELYYFYKTMEQKDASFKQNSGNPFFDYRTKEAIASRNELRRIAFLNSFDSKTLGVTEYRDFRKQAKQLEFEILSLDEDESSKELHIRLLSQIEVLPILIISFPSSPAIRTFSKSSDAICVSTTQPTASPRPF